MCTHALPLWRVALDASVGMKNENAASGLGGSGVFNSPCDADAHAGTGAATSSVKKDAVGAAAASEARVPVSGVVRARASRRASAVTSPSNRAWREPPTPLTPPNASGEWGSADAGTGGGGANTGAGGACARNN